LAFFGFLAYFGLLLLGTLSIDFRFFDCVRQPHVSTNDPENLTKIKFDNFEQCALEVVNIAVSTEYFRVAGGLNNGVMVTTPTDSFVMVRDRPHNILGVE